MNRANNNQVQVFDHYVDPIGMRMASEFHEFLVNYQLSSDDANYDFYTMNVEDTDQPIYHYRNVADNIRGQEL